MSSPLDVRVCHGRSCSEKMSPYILARLQREYDRSSDVTVQTCLCQGKCQEGPVITIGSDVLTRQNPISASEEIKRRIQSAKMRMRESWQKQ